MKYSRLLLPAALVAATSVLGSCDDGLTGISHVVSVELSAPSDTLISLGASVRLRPVARTSSGTEIGELPYAWYSSAVSVATVDSTGLVTAVSNGTALIVAAIQGLADSLRITVRQRAAVVTILAPLDTLTALGDSALLQVAAQDANDRDINDAVFAWRSSDTLVATAADGVLRARGNGLTAITASADGVSDTKEAVVWQRAYQLGVQSGPTDAVAGVRFVAPVLVTVLDRSANRVTHDNLTMVTAALDLQDATLGGVLTKRAQGGLAMFDDLVIHGNVGRYALTFLSDGLESSQAHTLDLTTDLVGSVVVDGSLDTLRAVGEEVQLTATAFDTVGAPVTDAAFLWSSSDPDVAVVDERGLVTAVGNGQATIAAMVGPVVGSAPLAVAQAVATVTVTPAVATIRALGTALQLTAQALDANTVPVTGVQFLWFSSDQAVAVVDTIGIVTAMAPGTATITAAARGVPGTAAVTVGTPPATVMTKVAGDSQSAPVGGTVAVPPSVRVVDSAGLPVPDLTVRFAIVSGGGTATGATQTTDTSGVATVTGWVLGPLVGLNELTATILPVSSAPARTTNAGQVVTGNGPNLAPPADTLTLTFVATGTAGTVAAVTAVRGDSQAGPIGSTLPDSIVVLVTDGNGNPVPGAQVVWTVVMGNGTVDPDTVPTDAAGGAGTAYTLGLVTGIDSVSATAGPASVTFAIQAHAGPPTSLSLAGGDGQTGSVNTTLTIPLSVLVRDSANNPAPDVLVTWQVRTGGGAPDSGAVRADSLGVAQVRYTLGPIVGPELVRATVAGVGFVDFSLTAAALEPVSADSSLLLLTLGADTSGGGSPDTLLMVVGDTATITLVTRDSLGNPLTRGGHAVAVLCCGAIDTVWIDLSVISFVDFVDNGDGTYTGGLIARGAGKARGVDAVINSLGLSHRALFRVVAPVVASGATSTMTISRSTLTVGDTAAITIQARDSLGNDITVGGNFVRLWTVSSVTTGDGTFSFKAGSSDGTYSFTFTATKSGAPVAIRASIDWDTLATAPLTVTVLNLPPDPTTTEALISLSYLSWWQGSQGGGFPGIAMSTMADEVTMSWGNFGIRDMSSEPRAAYDNSPTYAYRNVTEDPWEGSYSALSAIHDGVRALNDGVELGGVGGPDNPRALAFAKFVQGLAHAWLALQFDSAFIFDESVDITLDTLTLQPYPTVWAAAEGYLLQAIAIAQANTFTLPSSWINGNALTNTQLAQLAYSYLARMKAHVPRTPAERAALDWNSVNSYVDQGITQDFSIQGTGSFGEDWTDDTKYLGSWVAAGSNTWGRADYKTIGEADTSGNFATWLAEPLATRTEFQILTADQRVTAPGNPLGNGTDFGYFGPSPFPASRGTYHFSFYAPLRYASYVTADGFAPIEHMTVTEMQLIKAEGLLFANDLAGAVAIINNTRVTRGGLPAALSSEPMADLFTKLRYEKRIETYLLCSGCAYFDRRSAGPLAPTGPANEAGLVEGTPLHFPMPGSELLALGLPNYTYGGVGNEGGTLVAAVASALPGARQGVPAHNVYRFNPGMTVAEKLEHLRGSARLAGPPLSLRPR